MEPVFHPSDLEMMQVTLFVHQPSFFILSFRALQEESCRLFHLFRILKCLPIFILFFIFVVHAYSGTLILKGL